MPAERALRDSEGHTDAGVDYPAQLIVALIGQEKLDEAEEVARKFIRNYPTNAHAHALLGEVYLNRKQYEPARAQLIRALRTDPQPAAGPDRPRTGVARHRQKPGRRARSRKSPPGFGPRQKTWTKASASWRSAR